MSDDASRTEGPIGAYVGGSRDQPSRISERSRAVWGLTGGILGAVVAGGFTLASVHLQQKGDLETSEAEFLRSERIEVYGNYLEELQRLEKVEMAASSIFRTHEGPVTGDSAVVTVLATVNEANRTFMGAAARAAIVCELPVCATSAELLDRHLDIADIFIDGTDKLLQDGDAPNAQPVLDSFKKAQVSAIQAAQEFRNAAKAELGIGD